MIEIRRYFKVRIFKQCKEAILDYRKKDVLLTWLDSFIMGECCPNFPQWV